MKTLTTRLIVFLTILAVFPNVSLSQTQDEQNLKKYWDNRDRLGKYFIRIGSEPGMSLPCSQREPYNSFGSLNGMMKWADAPTHHGLYLLVLATEYELLKRDNKNTDAVLNELYYALNAINRIDGIAERYISQDPSRTLDLNGWFLRDDVEESFINLWNNQGSSMEFVHSDSYKSQGNSPSSPSSSFFNAMNEPSWDQVAALLMGISFIKKYVPNVFVRPTSNDAGFYLVDEATAIVDRMMVWVTTYKDYKDANFVGKRNWCHSNPITGEKVGNGADWLFYLQAYPFAKIAENLTGNNYYIDYTRKQLFPTPGLLITIPMLRSENPLYLSSTLDELWNDNISDVAAVSVHTHDNAQKLLNIAALSKTLPRTSSTFNLNSVEWWSDHENIPFYLLMYDVLHDVAPPQNEYIKFRNLINDMQTCEGCHNFNTDNTTELLHGRGQSNWAKTNRWTNADIANSGNGEYGNYNSLDFMAFYNLFHLKYANELSLPSYGSGKEMICPCSIGDAKFIENEIEASNIYRSSSTIAYTHIIPKYPFTYNNINIKLQKYIVEDVDIQASTGKLEVYENIKYCGNKTLTINNGGILEVKNSSNTYTPEIIFSKGTSLIVEPGGIIRLEDNTKLIIDEGSILQFSQGTIIELNGENAVLEIRGNLVLMADANFKTIGDGFVRFNIPTVNNSPNITVNGNNCQMLFESTNIGDKRIEVSSNTNLYPPSNLKLFKLENSTAHLGVKAGIFLPCDFHIIGNTITRIPNLVDNSISGGGTRIHNGITIYAISHTQTISDNTFSDGKKALTLLNPQGFYDIKVHYNDFTNCDMGIQIRNGRSHIFANSFLDCGQAVQALDFARSIRFESNFIGGSNNTETGFGFEITSPNYGEVAIAGNAFNNTITGFHADKAAATLQCNYFYHNRQAIDALHSGNLNISSIVPSSGISLANGNPFLGGYNYFNIPTNKKGIRITTPWHLVSPNFLNSYINEGFNSFSNDNAGNYNHPSWETNRPTNTLSTISPDIIINNNYWGQQATTYTPPSSPYNYIDVNHGASIHFKIDENYTPRYILGTNSTSTTTCPVSDWTDALTNPQSFNPNTKRPPSGNGPVINSVRKGSTLGGFNGSYGGTNTTQNVPSGAYSGINVKTAFQTVFNGFSQEVPIAGGGTETQVTLQGLLNLSALLNATIQLTSPEVKSMNVFGYQKYLSGIGDAIGAGAFIDNPNGKSSQLAAANALFNKILLINDQTNTSDTPHYQMKFQTELDRMIVNWMFGEYSNALSINDYISTFVRSEEQERLSYWNCVIENERKVMSNEITALEYAQNTSTCALLYPYSPELWYGINSSQGGSGGSSTPSISYTLSPNPATTTITVSMNLTIDADVNIAVFNKFGVKVVSDIDMGSLLAGNHNQAVVISGLPADVYNMAVYVNGVPYVQHFIKQTE